MWFSTTRCIYTGPVRLECGPDLLLKCLSDRIYITKCMKWPDVNSPTIYFHVIFIKMKLSSRLCLTHKRVTQKYRNSTLIKKKKNCARIGSAILRIFWIGSDRIWKNGIVASLHQTQQCRWPEGRYQSNLGFHTTSAVPQTDHLHATLNWGSN